MGIEKSIAVIDAWNHRLDPDVSLDVFYVLLKNNKPTYNKETKKIVDWFLLWREVEKNDLDIVDEYIKLVISLLNQDEETDPEDQKTQIYQYIKQQNGWQNNIPITRLKNELYEIVCW
jgi:hypothetical protein